MSAYYKNAAGQYVMPVTNAARELVEIPVPHGSHGCVPIENGEIVGELPSCPDSWTGYILTVRGWDRNRRDYCNAAFLYNGETYFPIDRFATLLSIPAGVDR